MGFAKLVERLYLKVFVGITASHSGIHVVVEMLKNGEAAERFSQSFGGDADAELSAFLEPYLAESPLHYVALLNSMDEQGALPVGSEKEAERFADLSTALTLAPGGEWLLYASKPGIDALQKRFGGIGVDFIFSPFSVLEQFFADKIDTTTALFVLLEDDAVSAAIFSEGRLLFARHLGIAHEDLHLTEAEENDGVSLSFELDIDGIEEGLELEDINAIDDLEGLDDLDEIEDLDTMDDLESFTEEEEIVVPARNEEISRDEGSLEGFDKDYKRFQLIQMTLEHYYGDPKYDSRFVESVYIADGCGLDDDLKHYLEEELFMKVYVRRIDIPAEIADLAKRELHDAS